MGADLIGVGYIAFSDTAPYPVDEAHEALRRLVFGLPEDKLEDYLTDLNLDLDVPDDDDNAGRDVLLTCLLTGLDDFVAAYSHGHRHHSWAAGAPDGSYWLGWAGGTSFGDDPYDGWSEFVALLNLIPEGGPDLVKTLRLDSPPDKYLKPRKEVVS